MIAAITELIGWVFAWPAAFGGLRARSMVLYLPGQFLAWRPLLAAGDRWLVDATAVAGVAAAMAIAIRVWLDLTQAWRPHRFGAGRWARRADLRRRGLL